MAMWCKAPILRTNRIKRGIENKGPPAAVATGTAGPEVEGMLVVTMEAEARVAVIMEEATEAEVLEVMAMAAGVMRVEAVSTNEVLPRANHGLSKKC